MSTIASLAINLTAGTAGFVAGMNKGIGSVGSLALSVRAASSALGSFVSGLATGNIVGFVKGAIESVDATKDMASQLGVTTDALTRLHFAATINGSSAEAMDTALGKMNKNLADAAVNGGPAADALATLGLDAEDLANMTPDAALRQIAAAMSQIDNPAQRAALAVDIFGKSGQNIINVLKLGADGLQEWSDESDRVGFTLSQIDAEKIGAAKDSIDEAGMAVQGLGNQIATELSPFIQVATDQFVNLVAAGKQTGTIGAIIDGIVSAIGVTGDAVQALGVGWVAMKATFMEVMAAILDGIASIADGVSGLLSKVGLGFDTSFIHSLANEAHDAADQLNQEFTDGLSGPTFSKKLQGMVDETRRAADEMARAAADDAAAFGDMAIEVEDAADAQAEAIDNQIAKLREQVDTFGLSASGAELYKLMVEGATDAQLAEAQSLLDTKDAMEQQQRLMDEGARLTEQMRTPQEQYADTIQHLNDLLDQGAIDQETFNRASEDAQKKLDQSTGDLNAPQQLAARSLRFTQGAPGNGRGGTEQKLEGLAKNADKQTTFQQQMTEYLRQLSADFVVVSI